ncbi:MAG: signal peptidase II [Angelakisella sp.]
MSGLFYLLLSGGLVAVDYFIKQWAALSLKPITSIDLIPNVLSLHYHENFGAAFGILQQKRFFLIAVTAIVIVVLVGAILLKKVQGTLMLSSLSLIIAGGLGNLIDRVMLGYVIDYIYFEPINFPIFNFADCCVVIGTGLLAIYILFIEGKDKPAPADIIKAEGEE